MLLWQILFCNFIWVSEVNLILIFFCDLFIRVRIILFCSKFPYTLIAVKRGHRFHRNTDNQHCYDHYGVKKANASNKKKIDYIDDIYFVLWYKTNCLDYENKFKKITLHSILLYTICVRIPHLRYLCHMRILFARRGCFKKTAMHIDNIIIIVLY